MKLFNIFGGKKKLEKENKFLNDEISKRDKTIEGLNKQIAIDCKSYNLLEANYSDLKSDYSVLKFAIDEKMDVIQNLKQENKELKTNLNRVTKEKEELDQKIMDMQVDTKYYKIQKLKDERTPKGQKIRISTRTKANQVQKELKEKANLREGE